MTTKGYKHSEENKRKASEFIKERNRIFGNPMTGKHHTEETKLLQSLSHMGKSSRKIWI